VAASVRTLRALPDPVGQIVDGWRLENGIEVRRVRVPLGVIAVIYEARPNVTVDAACLCLKTGNAVILRGGSAALHSNRILSEDLMENSKVPVIFAAGGNCHVYVDASADIDMAVPIIVNAKCQRPGVCNAAETLLVHKDAAETLLPRAAEELKRRDVELVVDKAAAEIIDDPTLKRANKTHYETEFLALKLAVRVVESLDEALEHIATYGTRHSEVIITEDLVSARRFTAEVDAACVYVNASTRFTDGGQFGLGAEMGISTQKLHVRGPIALQELTCVKYELWGDGQIRG
jgi:glutamate-5-semialdehyde dehydrogenase